MSNFKDLFEKAKFSKAGGGYVESFLNDNTNNAITRKLTEAVKEFIVASEEYADEEGISTKEQKEMIIDDVLAYLNNTLK